MTPAARAWALRLALLLLVAGAVALVVVGLGPLLHPEPIEVAAPDPDCELEAGPCTASFSGGGAASLSIGPAGIPVLTPLTLDVVVRDLEVSRVEVDFAGVDMSMGYNRPALAPAGPHRYVGEGMLPACVKDRMTWEARVLLHTPVGLLAAPFRFETRR